MSGTECVLGYLPAKPHRLNWLASILYGLLLVPFFLISIFLGCFGLATGLLFASLCGNWSAARSPGREYAAATIASSTSSIAIALIGIVIGLFDASPINIAMIILVIVILFVFPVTLACALFGAFIGIREARAERWISL